jgi:hypothetical protein
MRSSSNDEKKKQEMRNLEVGDVYSNKVDRLYAVGNVNDYND